MGKVAFLFSGQGAQKVSMGEAFYHASPAARAVYDQADALSGGMVTRVSFQGPQEELNRTLYSQPCLMTMEAAALAALREAGVTPQAAAGFSLGELTAMLCAGMVDFETAFAMVSRRAALMDAAAQAHPGGMAAILGAGAEKVEALCREAGAEPVNYNCPGQIVAAGTQEAVARLLELAAAQGLRAVPLAVSGAFHSSLMREAAAAYEAELEGFSIQPPQIPLYANRTAQPYPQEGYRGLIASQICHPVRWEETIAHLRADGVDTFVEVGPGKTLCGFLRRIDRGLAAAAVEDPASLEKALALVAQNA